MCQKEENEKDVEEEEEEKEKGRTQGNEVVEQVPRVVSRFLCEDGR